MRFHTLLFICLLCVPGVNRLLAQRPQGSSQSYTAVAAKGTDLLALSIEGQILLSTDGGSTYSEIHSVGGTDALYGLAVNGNIVIAAGKDGSLLHADFSVDNTLWIESNPTAIAGDLRALDSNGVSVWIAVGDAVLQSINNGLSWSDVSPAAMDSLQGVVFIGIADKWVAVGGSFGAEAFYSDDGGATWTASTVPDSAGALLAVAADSAGNVLAVGENGTALLSTDQGITFTALTSVDVTQDLTGVDSSAANQWMLGGTQRVLLAVDSTLDSSSTVLGPVGSGLDDGKGLVIVDGAVVMAGVASVPAPQITAPVTSAFTSIEVTLVPDASTEQSFYTLDGSAPDSTDLLYSSPFTISETLTVYAVSQSDGVYSAVTSQDFEINLHTLSIAPNGSDIDLTLDNSVTGYDYELFSNTDLTDNAGWINAGTILPGTGNPLTWNIPNPASPLFWRVEIRSGL